MYGNQPHLWIPAFAGMTDIGLNMASSCGCGTSTAREIADQIRVTERTVHKIISDLEQAGYIARRKSGRRNVYSVEPNLPLRHHTKKDVMVSELLEALTRRDFRGIMESHEGSAAADRDAVAV